MNVTTEQIDIKDKILLTRINHLYNLFMTSEDQIRAQKIVDLANKILNQEKTIAFCGHFSAGKSSMINHLLGSECLPSSPIPTSANLVKIKSGKKQSINLFYSDGRIEGFNGEVRVDDLKEFFIDGQLIQKIEIETPSNLPDGAVILDTPGIDSTDDAHRLSTESVLHLADVCFYIMDYNHVQAEQNFLFARKMMENNKPLYIVVNMIDKHQEQELSFQKFKDSVAKSFQNWGIIPQAIFFTSLRDLQHPYNELELVIEELMALYQEKHEFGIVGSLKMLVDEHLNYLEEQNNEIQYELENKVSGLDEAEIFDQYHQLHDEKLKYSHLVDDCKKNYQSGLQAILNNAYLMSAPTRDSAKEFLETTQKDFKVGFIFSQKKTQEIKKQKLQVFQEKIQENSDSQLLWHVKELFLKLLRENDLLEQQLEQAIHNLNLNITEDMVLSAVKKGALVNGQAVIQYTNDLAEIIKKKMFTSSQQMYEQFELALKKKIKVELSRIDKQLEKSEEFLNAIKDLDDLNKRTNSTKKQLEQILTINKVEDIKDIYQLVVNKTKVTRKRDGLKSEKVPNENNIKNNKEMSKNHSHYLEVEQMEERHQQLIQKIETSIKVLKSIPNFEYTTNQLTEKLTKLKNEQYTVALFGAFSAGKSSFANALVGRQMLPVSPNPTTAAICRIVPVPEEQVSETGIIKLKTEKAVLEDVNEALEPFSVKAFTIQEAIHLVQNIVSIKTDTNKWLNQKAFLNAFLNGVKEVDSNLGSQFIVGKKEFQRYISEEERSLFVETADFYLESDMTNKGITLVDTPGADSINARHTDVAFEYIKNADAIIFITYYNHAFSKADREFLIQLGRVKDQFSLDKMFFLVNACDLAKDESELTLVLDYVENQLLQYGITQPKLYPISAMHALKAKLQKESFDNQWHHFETDFYNFLKADLRLTAMNGAEHELQVAKGRIEKLLDAAALDKEVKDRQKEVLLEEKTQLYHFFHSSESNLLETMLKQEVEELIYYLNQRCYLRYTDFFKEAFNPTTIKGSGHLLKLTLNEALRDLLVSLGFDIAQELRATSLRIEKYIKKILDEHYTITVKHIQDINHQLSFSEFSIGEMATPVFHNQLKDLSISSYKSILNKVGSTKALFEKDEKKKLADDIRKQLEPVINEYLSKNQEILSTHYVQESRKQFVLQMNRIRSEVEEQYSGFESILEDQIDLVELKRQYIRLNDILEK